VGGWGDLDICSGVYSKWLCKELARLYEANFAGKDCKKMMQEAADNSPHQGSTTVVMAHLHDQDSMSTCNLGDSGYVLYRSGEKLFRTPSGQYSFDFPHQVGPYSKKEPTKLSTSQVHKTHHNDLVIMGTDGLFDNVFEERMMRECVSPRVAKNGDLADVHGAADCLATLAEVLSYD